MANPAVHRFEDLIAWQKARELTKAIYETTRSKVFATDFDLVRQIRRASVSVMSNIAEGFERSGNNEFHQFLVIAKGSCAEVCSQLYVAFDAKFLTVQQFELLLLQVEELGRVIGGLRASIAAKRTNR